MDYRSIKEASEKWGISDSGIRLLCREGIIEGLRRSEEIGQFPPLQ